MLRPTCDAEAVALIDAALASTTRLLRNRWDRPRRKVNRSRVCAMDFDIDEYLKYLIM